MIERGCSREVWLAGGETIALRLGSATRRIFVRASGTGTRAMLFLHGFPTSSWDWSRIEPALAAGRRLFFFDFLGFGASEKPRRHRYDLCEQADLAERVAQHFGIARAHVVAHDYGDSVAQELLARELRGTLGFALDGVTLLNGGLYPRLHRPVRLQRLLRSPLGPAIVYALDERRFTAALAAVFAAEHRPAPGEFRQHWESVVQNGGHRLGHRLIAYIDDRRRHERRWVEALEQTQAPLRFVWGMLDAISGAHVMEHLHRQFDGRAVLIELPDVGHYPQIEAPDRVVAAIGSP